MRFYCTVTGTETTVESDSTIPSTVERVAWFFEPNDGTYIVNYDDDNLPIKVIIGDSE